MEALGIALIVLCYFFGKAELGKQRHRHEMALLALLPEDERVVRARKVLG